MRLSGISLATILLFSSVVFAQHSGSGNSAGSSGSGSSGASSVSSGSHGGGGGSSGGGSSYSGGGGHSAGGAGGSHSSSGHSSAGGSTTHAGISGSSGRGSNSVISTRPGSRPVAGPAIPARVPRGGFQLTTVNEKRTFASFLRHPFRKPVPKTVIVFHPPFCLKGPCRTCPPGQVRSGGGCVAAPVPVYRNVCSHREIWNGGACIGQTPFLDPCLGFRAALDRETQRMQAAQSEQQNACAQAESQACSEATAAFQNEASVYRLLEEKYRQCRLNSRSAYSTRMSGFPRYGLEASFDPLRFEMEY